MVEISGKKKLRFQQWGRKFVIVEILK